MDVLRGTTVTVPGQFRDWQGTLVAPANPLVSVIDSDGAVVTAPTVPTVVGVGLYEFDVVVPVDAPVGLWSVQWQGVIDDALIEDTVYLLVKSSWSSAETGGCAAWAALDAVPCDEDAYAEGRLQMALDAATALLRRATLGLYGVCTDVVRPCSSRAISTAAWGGYGWRALPWWSNTGDVAGWPCSCIGDDVRPCGCGTHRGLTLPLAPVREIVEVLVDGVEFTDWNVLDGVVLQRTDGVAWPCCQHLDREPTEIGTWQVTYTAGADVPADGVMAVGVLACELAKSWTPGMACALPERVTSVVSEGLTVAMALDSLDQIHAGWFGHAIIDGFVASVNPQRLATQAKWLSVDTLAAPRRIT